jgi:hypothetical protein
MKLQDIIQWHIAQHRLTKPNGGNFWVASNGGNSKMAYSMTSKIELAESPLTSLDSFMKSSCAVVLNSEV